MAYQTAVQKHVPRAYKKHVDVLANLASKIDVQNEAIDVRIMKRTYKPPWRIYFLQLVDVQDCIVPYSKI